MEFIIERHFSCVRKREKKFKTKKFYEFREIWTNPKKKNIGKSVGRVDKFQKKFEKITSL